LKLSLLDWLRCPACHAALTARVEVQDRGEVRRGQLICSGCQASFPIVDSVPRFVNSDSYAQAFSFEWNIHQTTQLDSVNGRTDSEDRFARNLEFPLSQLVGKLVLDIGCGTGRFAEIALKHGATVIGVDLSLAVDAAFKNIGEHPRMHIVQADVFRLPLRREAFDLIYSFGVLHHTPDCRKAFEQLPPHLKPAGTVAITLYSGHNKHYVTATDFWRRWTPRLPKRVLYALCHVAVPLYYLYRIPGLRQLGMGIFPINMDPDWRWRVLDTFDCYSPTYQSYHSYPEVFEWFERAGLRGIRIVEPAVTVTGTRLTSAVPEM
jgi:SAM-dependent methyltransferase